jgi:hypothetical protein
MNAPRIAYLLAALLVVAPVELEAQRRPPHIGPGDRVRLWAPRLGIEGSVGTVMALRPDTIVVDRGETLVLAISTLTRLEVSRGQKSRAGTGGIVGLVGGAAVGVLIGTASIDADCEILSPDCDVNKNLESFALAAVAGGVVGYGVGVLLGSIVKVDRWEEVPLSWLRVRLAPGRRGGFSVGLRVKL